MPTFERQFFQYLTNLERNISAKPLILGGIAASGGGIGGPPGGFQGRLPQTRVTFDTSELAISGIPPSGMSLLDNLNRIRYRLANLEAISGYYFEDFLDLPDTPSTYTGQAGRILVVDNTENEVIFVEGVSGIDLGAIHKQVADEIHLIPAKTVTSASDVLILEDSDDSWNKKRVTLANLLSYSGSISFLELVDTPTSYSGYGGYIPIVKQNETGLEFLSYSGSVGVGGWANPRWFVDGALATATEVGGAFIADSGLTITGVYVYCKDTGSASSTIIDVNKNGTTIYTTQGNRPELDYDDADKVVSGGDPDITQLAENDILTIDIDQVATGAEGLSVLITFAQEVSAQVGDFLDLNDTPSTYTGQDNKVLVVDETADEVVFLDPSGIDTNAFHMAVSGEILSLPLKNPLTLLDLFVVEDSLDKYKKRRVTLGQMFSTLSGAGATNFLELSDSPGTYIGSANKYIKVNETATGLQFTSFSGVDNDAIHRNIANEINLISSKTTWHNNDVLILEDFQDSWNKKKINMGNLMTNVLRTNISSQIHGLTQKTTPANDDEIIIEDSAAAWAKKRVKISNLPAGAGGDDADAIHDNEAGEIQAITTKSTLANNDVLILEDSEDSYNKKSTTISNLIAAVSGGGGNTSSKTYLNRILALSPWQYWRMNDSSSTASEYYAGLVPSGIYDGSFSAGVVVQQTGINPDGTVCPHFSGGGHGMFMSISGYYPTHNGYTYSFVMRPDSLATPKFIYEEVGDGERIHIYLESNGDLYLTTSGTFAANASAGTISNATTYHIMCVVNQEQRRLQIYVNGELTGICVTGNGFLPTDAEDSFIGKMSDFARWGIPLDTWQAKYLYDGTRP